MTWTIALIVFCGSQLTQASWIAAGDRALDAGHPAEAAADFARALDDQIRAGIPTGKLVHLRVTLATAYMEAGDERAAEAALQEAQRAEGAVGGLARAEVLNGWSVVHLRLGQLSVAEGELEQAWRIAAKLPAAVDLRPTVLHNLAAVQMRTGRYADALGHEREALRMWESAPVPHPAELIRAWASLASLEYMMGQPQDARKSMQQALAAATASHGPSSALLAAMLDSDAVILDKLRLKKEARQARAQAQRIRGCAPPRTDDRLVVDLREKPESRVHLRDQQ